MKYQIRKVEAITIYRSTVVVELDEKKFSKLEDNPFTGAGAEEFAEYLANLDFTDPPFDLDDDSVEKLQKISESEWTEYASSADKGSSVWLQIGKEDSQHRRTGGFRVDQEVESNY